MKRMTLKRTVAFQDYGNLWKGSYVWKFTAIPLQFVTTENEKIGRFQWMRDKLQTTEI